MMAWLASTTATGLSKDTRDTPMRRTRHRDGRLLKGGVGLTTGLGWSDRLVACFFGLVQVFGVLDRGDSFFLRAVVLGCYMDRWPLYLACRRFYVGGRVLQGHSFRCSANFILSFFESSPEIDH